MKVFTVKKENEDELKSKHRDKVSYISLNKKDKFNYIVIRNPSDSNEICTIKNMKILSENETNGICLMHGEEEMFRGKGEVNSADKMGIFNVESRIQRYQDNKKIELIRSKLSKNKECDILRDSVLIVLPKGCLFIKLDNEVSNLRMNIDWTSEKIC
ncbi:hypothetical protein GOM49_01310 [Clostridium bovifaecis]|uniref:Uncharacterized protein n=1 Tax=Clostridium bovifaecis TaxID=2184719 RepID=A0A6I6EPE3_9CLOT|nr:hypothetical protein GOM49_01310 [Clostridium bovifaecis]